MSTTSVPRRGYAIFRPREKPFLIWIAIAGLYFYRKKCVVRYYDRLAHRRAGA